MIKSVFLSQHQQSTRGFYNDNSIWQRPSYVWKSDQVDIIRVAVLVNCPIVIIQRSFRFLSLNAHDFYPKHLEMSEGFSQKFFYNSVSLG